MHKKFCGAIASLMVTALIITTSLAIMRNLFPIKYMEEIKDSCTEFGVDINLVLALIKTESNFNPDAVSHAKAHGVMQLTEDTFRFCNSSLGIQDADIFIPRHNIHAGVWYLSYLLNRYNGNIENALAAYNAGPFNTDRWLKNEDYSKDGKTLTHIPFDETKRHIEKIRRYRVIYRLLY